MKVFIAGLRRNDVQHLKKFPDFLLLTFDDLQTEFGGGGEQRTIFKELVEERRRENIPVRRGTHRKAGSRAERKG